MRVTIERDGKTTIVDVAPGVDAVTIGTERYPVSIVRTTGLLVELEIAGERVVVENWPEHFPDPPGPVDVNGERWRVGVSRETTTAAGTPSSPKFVPPPAGSPSSPAGPPPGGPGGVPVVPPMPGKVIEVRVKDGDPVRKGDVLLVLEAMKMRNEVTSPVDGVVRGLRVSSGSNARAREPMVFVVPD
ncbi:MAG: biotin/lipoyl-containing protein [Thermoplasmata archaeon]